MNSAERIFFFFIIAMASLLQANFFRQTERDRDRRVKREKKNYTVTLKLFQVQWRSCSNSVWMAKEVPTQIFRT